MKCFDLLISDHRPLMLHCARLLKLRLALAIRIRNVCKFARCLRIFTKQRAAPIYSWTKTFTCRSVMLSELQVKHFHPRNTAFKLRLRLLYSALRLHRDFHCRILQLIEQLNFHSWGRSFFSRSEPLISKTNFAIALIDGHSKLTSWPFPLRFCEPFSSF